MWYDFKERKEGFVIKKLYQLFFVALILLIFSIPKNTEASEGWLYVSSSSTNQHIFVQKADIVMNRLIIREKGYDNIQTANFWIKMIDTDLSSVLGFYEIALHGEPKWRMLKGISYDKHGLLLVSSETPSEWMTIFPDTLAESAYRTSTFGIVFGLVTINGTMINIDKNLNW